MEVGGSLMYFAKTLNGVKKKAVTVDSGVTRWLTRG